MPDFSEKRIIAMIHVGALPGTPRAKAPLSDLIQSAVAEAKLCARLGVDALLIENMHDLPYLRGAVGPEIVAAMTAVTAAVRSAVPLPLGVQVLAAANREALAVALAAGADFIRAENFSFAHVADEGLMPEAAAGPLLRYRRMIGAEGVRVLADVRKKHASHAITADVTLAEAAKAAEWMGADGLIITGAATGRAADPADVCTAADAVRVPVLVGSGVTAENLDVFWPHAAGFIVGSSLKHGGAWDAGIDERRLGAFMAAATALRGSTG
ncbi:MAG: BtpA/SgcQ family protein [Phycisphaerales bacterium]|nr:BtpA/SgcQ family protein [Phycisphaerales bacterium]